MKYILALIITFNSFIVLSQAKKTPDVFEEA